MLPVRGLSLRLSAYQRVAQQWFFNETGATVCCRVVVRPRLRDGRSIVAKITAAGSPIMPLRSACLPERCEAAGARHLRTTISIASIKMEVLIITEIMHCKTTVRRIRWLVTCARGA